MKKSLALFILIISLFTGKVHADNTVIQKSLANIEIIINKIHSAPIAEMKTVLTNSGIVYTTVDDEHIHQGLIYDVSNMQPVNDNNQLLMKKLNNLKSEMIIYKAAQEKNIITIFTNITCRYCRMIHNKIQEYNKLGITVCYLAFPYTNMQDQSEKKMKAIWCAKDRNKAFNDAMNGKNVQPISCDINIKNHYNLGVQLGITGTPAIVFSNGYVLLGYQDPKDIKILLDNYQK